MTREPRPMDDVYLNFLLTLNIATWIDAKEYAAWVERNAVGLSIGFERSDEFDLGVYGRMQYVRSIGRGV